MPANSYINIKDLLDGTKRLETPDKQIEKQVKNNWDKVGKPIDSLGKLEDLTSRIGGILRDPSLNIDKKAVIAMCADNGIVKEGISQSGQDVTLSVAILMGSGNSSVCRMAKKAGIDVFPIDIGINTDELIKGVLDKKIAHGTKNFVYEPAMTQNQTLKALQTGMDIVKDAKEKGYKLLCTGEMGIGNTTTSAAIAASLLKCPSEIMTGRGSGLSDEGLKKKQKVIKEAITKYDLYNADALKILSCVGGFDIAGMAGVMIGGAAYHIPVVIDGVISSVAALTAVRLLPVVKDYLIASHLSKEPAAGLILSELKTDPIIHANMALGEGTGAVMLCSLLDIALTLYKNSLTYDDLRTEAYKRFN